MYECLIGSEEGEEGKEDGEGEGTQRELQKRFQVETL